MPKSGATSANIGGSNAELGIKFPEPKAELLELSRGTARARIIAARFFQWFLVIVNDPKSAFNVCFGGESSPLFVTRWRNARPLRLSD
jgi:hypothetical protein